MSIYLAGDLNKWQWLGKPLKPAEQSFSDLESVDLLATASWKWHVKPKFTATFESSADAFLVNVQYIPESTLPHKLWFGIRLEPKKKSVKKLKANTEYTLEFEARGNDVWYYAGQVFEHVPRMIAIGGAIDTRNKKPLSVLVDSKWRT